MIRARRRNMAYAIRARRREPRTPERFDRVYREWKGVTDLYEEILGYRPDWRTVYRFFVRLRVLRRVSGKVAVYKSEAYTALQREAIVVRRGPGFS